MSEERKKTSYFKHYDEFYGIIKPLSELQLGMLTEAIAIYRGFPLNKKTMAELISDPAVQIAFNAYKVSIDKGDRAYENKCEANRENGKKGGRPKKKRPEQDVEEPNESKLSITNSTESGICTILYDDQAYGDSLKKLKSKEKVADLIGYAAIYLGICDNCDYEFIYDCTEKSYSDFIDEMRKMALEAFGGNDAEFTKAFTNARDYAKQAMKCDRLKLGAAIEEYNERTEPA